MSPETHENPQHAAGSPRVRLIRETVILQIKLVADGLRDAILIPVSLAATLVGLLRGGEDCDREFRRVVKLGRRSDRWINLFGHQKPLGRAPVVGSVDTILEQVESAVTEQYRKSRHHQASAETDEGADADAGVDSGKRME
jgi:hypothetical protein